MKPHYTPNRASQLAPSDLAGVRSIPAWSEASPAVHARDPNDWLPVSSLDMTDQKVLAGLHRLVRASTMEEHFEAMKNLTGDVLWDAPPIYLMGSDNMRCVVYFAKWTATMDFKPHAVKITRLTQGRRLLEVFLDFYISPKGRSWWFSPVKLLPPTITVKATVAAGMVGIQQPEAPTTPQQVNVQANTGLVAFLWGRIHNWPALPTILRAVNGFVLGSIGRWLEPFWSNMVHLAGDATYQHKSLDEWLMGRNVQLGRYGRLWLTAPNCSDSL